MSDRPTDALVVHVHRSEQDADRNPGLLPSRTVVGGTQDVTALAHHHQSRTDRGPVEQQGFDRERRFDC